MKNTGRNMLLLCGVVLTLTTGLGVKVFASTPSADELMVSAVDEPDVQEETEEIWDEEYLPAEEVLINQEHDEELVGVTNRVGNGVTGTFDAHTGVLTLNSNDGTLWQSWLEEAGFNREKIKAIKVASGTVYLPPQATGGFYSDGAPKYLLFGGLKNLTELDLSSFDTSKATNMSNMFWGCSSLETITWGDIDTSNVTRMDGMFKGCTSLTTLDLSCFDTSKVTLMSSMFNECSSLKAVDMSSFVTPNLKSMTSMFQDCSSLRTIDMSSFITSNVSSMNNMFSGCSNLTSLNISSFNTANVTTMESMFQGCASLTSLDINGFDTSTVTYFSNMFKGCSKISSFDVSKFVTMKALKMDSMFAGCESLTSLDLDSFDTPNVTTMVSMFRDCSSLTALDLSGFDTAKVKEMDSMFKNCNSLTALNMQWFDTSKTESMSSMFSGCENLSSLDLSSFSLETFGVTKSDMLKECTGLQYLKTPKSNRFSGISLPYTMYDEYGKKYYELPVLSESIVLTKTDPTTIQPTATPTPRPTSTPTPTVTPTLKPTNVPTPTPQITNPGFSDVQDSSHPYYKAIYWAADNGITKGYDDGTFGTNRSCTRGEMIMFLWRFAHKPAVAYTSKSPFRDVPKYHAFYNAILWAYQKGITKGYPDGTFGVDRKVTRGESMMFLWRVKGKPTPKTATTSPFKDVPMTNVFYKAILWGAQEKVTTGYTSGAKKGTFGINENCTRGQIVTFLYRAR